MAAPPAASHTDPHAGSPIGSVIRVADGDTVVVDLDTTEETVRLLGVDTPETHHPRRDVEPYGKEAAWFTRNLLLDESVYVVRDETMPERDRHGRLLAYVYRASDGLFVNEELVRQGYARVYDGRPCTHADDFLECGIVFRVAGWL